MPASLNIWYIPLIFDNVWQIGRTGKNYLLTDFFVKQTTFCTSVPWRFQSVRCSSYGGVGLIDREFGYSKVTKQPPGPAPGVRLIEVSILQRCPLRARVDCIISLIQGSTVYGMSNSELITEFKDGFERVNNLIILASTTTAVKPTLALGVYSRVEAIQSWIKTCFVFIGVKMGTRLVNWFNWWEHVARSVHNILTILLNWAVLSQRKWYFLFWRNFKK